MPSPSGGGTDRVPTCYVGTTVWYRSRSWVKPTPRRNDNFNPSQFPWSDLSQIWVERRSGINRNRCPNLWHIPWSLQSAVSDGGDYGELGESSAHPKPVITSSVPRTPEVDTKQGAIRKSMMEVKNMTTEGKSPIGKWVLDPATENSGAVEDEKNWAMEVYRGGQDKVKEEDSREKVLELDLDEEVELATKFMAIAVFYSRKSYSLQALFGDMLMAWGIPKLVAMEKLGDYSLKIKFLTEAEKIKVLDGGL
jgi:hypothetical protein